MTLQCSECAPLDLRVSLIPVALSGRGRPDRLR